MTYSIENRRYTGSKSKLINWIISLIGKKCRGDTFADIFAGTGVVAAAASNLYKRIIVNDLLYSNHACYKAFFENGIYDSDKLQNIIEEYNNIEAKSLEENYFSKNFGGKYFSINTAKVIGHIREDIESKKNQLTEKEYFMILTSLLYAVDKVANTVGHYDAYIQKPPLNGKLDLRFIKPVEAKKVNIFREDANRLAKGLKADVVYIDPPYNSRQYSRFYHLLETLVKWEKPKLHGVALKPEPENMSDYCRVKASEMFKDLIKNLDCKHIVVSYNNTYNSKSNSSRNKITLEEIRDTLGSKGSTTVHKKSHRFFTAGKTDFDDHQELVFLTKVKKNGS